MSFPKKGNSFPRRGGRPQGSGGSEEAAAFASAIADALRRELEPGRSALKIAAAWTDTNERTVKNWLGGRSGPSGHHLGQLARHSDEVLCAFLVFADRGDLLIARRLLSVRDKLHDLLRQVDALIASASSDPDN